MSSGCVRRLIEIESRARAGGTGFWDGAARVMAAGDPALGDRLGEFVTVEGTVVSVGGSHSNVYLNFGDDWSKDFTVIASRRDIKRWPDAGEDLARLEGERVRVRGYVERWNGPLIRIEHPAQVEVWPHGP
jgi:DNA/RNA endonuclease YhcR with UshA esterase domain